MTGLVVYAVFFGMLTWAWLWRWGLLTLVLVVLVAVDLTGMTPVYKSGTHEDRFFRIELDADRCVGDGAGGTRLRCGSEDGIMLVSSGRKRSCRGYGVHKLLASDAAGDRGSGVGAGCRVASNQTRL